MDRSDQIRLRDDMDMKKCQRSIPKFNCLILRAVKWQMMTKRTTWSAGIVQQGINFDFVNDMFAIFLSAVAIVLQRPALWNVLRLTEQRRRMYPIVFHPTPADISIKPDPLLLCRSKRSGGCQCCVRIIVHQRCSGGLDETTDLTDDVAMK